LPSTYFTSVSGTLTVSDDLIDPLIQLTTCKVLQSGASSGNSFEKIIVLPTAKFDWHKGIDKIEIDRELTGIGTFQALIQTSTDGISYGGSIAPIPMNEAKITDRLSFVI